MKLCDINRNQKRKEIDKKNEFWGIKSLIESGNIPFAIQALEEYLKKYPGNSYAIKEYASILRQQGRCEDALALLMQCESEGIHSIRERAFCYYYMGRYEDSLKEALKVCDPTGRDEKLNQVKNFARIKLGRSEEVTGQFYSVEQLVNYDREKAISQIKKHKMLANTGDCYLTSNYDLDCLFHNITSLLPIAEPTIVDDFMPYYMFYIKTIGYSTVKKDVVNYLKVVTLPNTFDILTMYPAYDIKKYAINNYAQMLSQKEIEDEKGPVMVKRESQVEKFNRRYGKK